MKKFLCPILALIVSHVCVQNSAVASGFSIGNGGDQVAIEFLTIANSLQDYVAGRVENFDFTEIDPSLFAFVVRTEVVRGVDFELKDKQGNVKDAVNFDGNPPTILVSQKTWQTLTHLQKYRLVFHEILGIMGIEGSDDYHLSGTLDQTSFCDSQGCYLDRQFDVLLAESIFFSAEIPNFEQMSGEWTLVGAATRKDSRSYFSQNGYDESGLRNPDGSSPRLVFAAAPVQDQGTLSYVSVSNEDADGQTEDPLFVQVMDQGATFAHALPGGKLNVIYECRMRDEARSMICALFCTDSTFWNPWVVQYRLYRKNAGR